LLDPDEEILASVVAQPRGTGVSRSGGGLGPQAVGSAWAKRSRGKADAAGLELTSPMALALSQKRLLVGKTITVALPGGEVKLEAGAGQDAKGLATQFDRLKATA
jgi:hypothetical protein